MSDCERDYKTQRILKIYVRITGGERPNKSALAKEYGVSRKTIQRDISDIRYFLEENCGLTIKYLRKTDIYSLEPYSPENEEAVNEEN